MFGHNRRNCHLTTIYGSDEPIYPHRYAMSHWHWHCKLNEAWIARGGAGHTLPEPKVEDFIKKTPFELACKNDCKITHADECCICMETLGEKNKVTTACGHQFHFGCLSQHTARSNACPMCRSVIAPSSHSEVKRRLILPRAQDINTLSGRVEAHCKSLMEAIVTDVEQRELITDIYTGTFERVANNLCDMLRDVNSR
jgi:hypothetical protein